LSIDVTRESLTLISSHPNLPGIPIPSEHLPPISKFLMRHWSAFNAEDIQLANIRVYNNATGLTGKKPCIVLFLPQKPRSLQPHQHTLFPVPAPTPTKRLPAPIRALHHVCHPLVRARRVQARHGERRSRKPDRSRGAPQGPLAERVDQCGCATVSTHIRTAILTARIKYDCNLRPMFDASYRWQMRERSVKYNTPQRQIRIIEDAGVSGGRGGVNRLSSGWGLGLGARLVISLCVFC
jgi:transcription initiation factor TFIIF subunit beta